MGQSLGLTVKIRKMLERYPITLLLRFRYEILLGIAIVLFSVVISYYDLLQYESFMTGAWDAGYFDQLMWRTLTKGVLFQATGDFVNPGGYFFGAHFSPVLFIVLPFYTVYPNLLTLIVVQNVAIALTAIPLYVISQKIMHDKLVSLSVAFVFLLYPPLHGATWFFFHVEAFFPLFVSLLFLSLLNEKKFISVLFLILALSVTEFSGVMVVLVIVFVIFIKKGFPKLKKIDIKDWSKRMKFEIGLFATCILWIIVAVSIVNLFNPNRLLLRWDTLGGGLTSQLTGLITKPDVAIRTLTQNPYEKFFYISMIFSPVLFLPVLSIASLVMIVPFIFTSFLSPISNYWNPLAFQYPLFIVAQIFIATIYGLSFLAKSRKRTDIRKVAAVCLLLTAVLAFAFSPFSPSLDTYGRVMNSERNRALTEILKLIPDNASVSTINNIFPHLAHRNEIYPFAAKADYILIDTRSPWWPGPIPSRLDVYNPYFDTFISDLSRNKSIGLLAAYDGIFLWKWGYNGPAINVFSNEETGLTSYYFQDPSLMLYNDREWEFLNGTSRFLNKTEGMQPVLLEDKLDGVIAFRDRMSTFPNGSYTMFVRAYTLNNSLSSLQFGIMNSVNQHWYKFTNVAVGGTPHVYSLNLTIEKDLNGQHACFGGLNTGNAPVQIDWVYIVPRAEFEMKVINPNFNWFTYAPVPGFTGRDHYGILFKGDLLAREDGNYTFALNSDDLSNLLVDNVRVSSNSWGLGLTNDQATIYLKKGFHEVALFYGNFLGGGSVNLEVRKDGVSYTDSFFSEPASTP